jgi:hypothetical protein
MEYNRLKITLGKRVFSKKEYDILIDKKVISIKSLDEKNEYIYDRASYSIYIYEHDFVVQKTTPINILGKVEACSSDTYKIKGIIESYDTSDWPKKFLLKKAEPIIEGHFLYVEFTYQGSLNVEIIE